MEATHGVSVCSGWSDASSPRAALDAVLGSKDLTGASLGIVFASADYDLDGLAAALDERFPCPVIGCTTSGEIIAPVPRPACFQKTGPMPLIFSGRFRSSSSKTWLR